MQRNPLAIPVAVLAFSTGCKDFDLCPEKSDGVCLPFFGGNGDDSEPTATTTSTNDSTATVSTVATTSSITGDSEPDSTTTTHTDTVTGSDTTASQETTADTTDGTTTSPDLCGNGVLDPNEECDNGQANDDDTYGGCKLDCTLGPRCGDDIVDTDDDHEACDAGPLNGMYGCSATCDGPGPSYCGDGVKDVEYGEVCDDMNITDIDGCPADCTAVHHLVFLSVGAYQGNIGSLSEADKLCQAEADMAALTGKYMAWLSDDVESPEARIAPMLGTSSLMRRDGKIVASNWDDLTDGQLQNSIALTLAPDAKPKNVSVWTNTTEMGAAKSTDSDYHCSKWTSNDNQIDFGQFGLSNALDDEWTDSELQNCGVEASLYCFQVSFETPP